MKSGVYNIRKNDNVTSLHGEIDKDFLWKLV